MLSIIEKETLSIINSVRCISVWQLTKIMGKFHQCSESQVLYIIRNLKNMGQIKFDSTQNYLILNQKGATLKKEMLAGITAGLWFIESQEEINLLMSTTGAYDMAFVASNKVYKCSYLTMSNIEKVRLLEQYYLKECPDNKKKKHNDYTTLLLFDKSEDYDRVFKQLQELDIKFPYMIGFVSENDFNEETEAEIYRLDTE